MTARTGRSGDVEPDAGSGSIWVLALLSVLALVAAGSIAAAVASAQQTGASAAADLAALAAANSLQQRSSPVDACNAAARVAAANAAVVDRCTVDGAIVSVVVRMTAPAVHGPRATARARAGPV